MKITQEHIDRKARFTQSHWDKTCWFEPIAIRGKMVVGWQENETSISFPIYEDGFIEITAPKKPSERIMELAGLYGYSTFLDNADKLLPAFIQYLDEIHEQGKI